MLISLSIVQFVLLLVHGVYSVDIHNSKRLPRRHTEVRRTYNSNHPPLMENYDIPAAIIHDKEDIQVSSKAVKHVDIMMEKPEPQLEIVDSIPVDVINDYEGEMLLKPRARSIDLKLPDNLSNTKGQGKLALDTYPEPKTLRRRSQVRKVKVNKSQLKMYINETESSINNTDSVNKDVQKVTPNVEQSSNSPKTQINFKRRKQLRDPVIPIVESESYVYSHSGDFHYSYEGGDGTKAYERGELKNSNGGVGNAVEGNFSYKDKDGNDFSLSYTADENGYRPVGAHLPTPPPIPPAIQRALDLLATKTTPETITERIKS